MQKVRTSQVLVAASLHVILLLAAEIAVARTIEVTVVDRDAQPVAGVAVFWRSAAETPSQAAPGTTAVMDQVDTRFEPHILIVQTGTSVEFPNSDTVAHHVYSFSHPNQFMLPIYKGDAHPPVTFTESGIVILGCNIHDNMLGYILVADSPAFGKTDEDGKVQISGAGNDGAIVIWNPRIRDAADTLVKSLASNPAGDNRLSFKLVKKLRPAFDDKTNALSWSDY